MNVLVFKIITIFDFRLNLHKDFVSSFEYFDFVIKLGFHMDWQAHVNLNAN